MRVPRPAAAAACALLAAASLAISCETAAPAAATPRADAGAATGADAEPLEDLPPGWSTRPRRDFEPWLRAALPGDRPVRLSPAVLDELADALGGWDDAALRAAVILGRSRDPVAGEVLLARLEQRVQGPERPSDAADVVAAAALHDLPGVRDAAGRLERLACGERPHPDLEVRVECAVGALARGRDAPIEFLLGVLRAGTPAGLEDEPDWEPKTTLAWSKGQAARALSERAGVPTTFHPDAPLAEQVAEAERLEQILLPGREPRPPGG